MANRHRWQNNAKGDGGTCSACGCRWGTGTRATVSQSSSGHLNTHRTTFPMFKVAGSDSWSKTRPPCEPKQ